MKSIKEIYKIGFGPSSSHTMGPAKAAKLYLEKYPEASGFSVTLYGSLALTGRGHLTDYILKQVLGSDTIIHFDYEKNYDFHPNALTISSANNPSETYFSIGGGDISQGEIIRLNEIYPHHYIKDIIAYCKKEQIDLATYVKRFDHGIEDYMRNVIKVMKDSILRGISDNTVLPGTLRLKPKAKSFYQEYLQNKNYSSLLYSYARSVSEENARGHEIVTSPTCGSSGVVPACLFSYSEINHLSEEEMINGLCVAGIIGNLAKENASISGAAVGCQGEVGVACSMAAGMMAYFKGGNINQIEFASEIALEHHLGMTCDPVDGLVQIPCIERNSMSGLFAVNAADYALLTDGMHRISLDQVIKVMNDTGKDLHNKYKETSQGGLAISYQDE